MSLTGTVVRVLSEEHHLGLGERREVECPEHIFLGGKDRLLGTLGGDKGLELLKIGEGELAPKAVHPVLLHPFRLPQSMNY